MLWTLSDLQIGGRGLSVLSDFGFFEVDTNLSGMVIKNKVLKKLRNIEPFKVSHISRHILALDRYTFIVGTDYTRGTSTLS